MKARPNDQTIATIASAARILIGTARRAFQATATLDHCHGSPRFTRELFGWNPNTIRKGLAEKERIQPRSMAGRTYDACLVEHDGLSSSPRAKDLVSKKLPKRTRSSQRSTPRTNGATETRNPYASR
jgi:hypothetical protein